MHYRNPDIFLCKTLRIVDKPMRTRRKRKTANKTVRKRKRKNLPTTPDEAPETHDNLGKEVAVDKDPEKEPTPDTQEKDPEQDMGLLTVTQPKDKTSSRERNVHVGGMSALLRATEENNTTESGKEQDKTVETDKPSAPSSTVEDSQVLEYNAKVKEHRAKVKEYRAKASELMEKGEDAECFDPQSVCSIACSAY